jgi:hypothetical protein
MVDRRHLRVVVMAEIMPYARVFIHPHVAHLYGQEILQHRLPDTPVVNVSGNAENG